MYHSSSNYCTKVSYLQRREKDMYSPIRYHIKPPPEREQLPVCKQQSLSFQLRTISIATFRWAERLDRMSCPVGELILMKTWRGLHLLSLCLSCVCLYLQISLGHRLIIKSFTPKQCFLIILLISFSLRPANKTKHWASSLKLLPLLTCDLPGNILDGDEYFFGYILLLWWGTCCPPTCASQFVSNSNHGG